MKDKSKAKANPLPITTKRLFFDMMDAAVAGGMPCARINLVHDAIRAMEDALLDIGAFGRSYGTTDTDAVVAIREKARRALTDWRGGDHAKA